MPHMCECTPDAQAAMCKIITHLLQIDSIYADRLAQAKASRKRLDKKGSSITAGDLASLGRRYVKTVYALQAIRNYDRDFKRQLADAKITSVKDLHGFVDDAERTFRTVLGFVSPW